MKKKTKNNDTDRGWAMQNSKRKFNKIVNEYYVSIIIYMNYMVNLIYELNKLMILTVGWYFRIWNYIELMT